MNGYNKNACTALKKLSAQLASEKKIFALTNSSTLPLKGQTVHPYRRNNRDCVHVTALSHKFYFYM